MISKEGLTAVKLVILFCLFGSCSNEVSNDYRRYDFLKEEFSFLDSTYSKSEDEVKLYLSFDFNHLDWEFLFHESVKSLISQSSNRLGSMKVNICYPKISKNECNEYITHSTDEIVRLEESNLEYFIFLVNTFDAYDFTAYDHIFQRLYEHWQEEHYKVTFLDVLLGLTSYRESTNERDWSKYLDALIEVEQNSPEKLNELLTLRDRVDGLPVNE